MEKTWKPTTAGILSIVAGAIELLIGIGLTVALGLAASLYGAIPGLPSGILPVFGVPLIIIGIVAIVGGIYALRRKIWGLTLAGSICALFCPGFILGILAIIFVIMGKNEFA
ncbi:MAG: hypothetical protein KAW00_00830 [Dehalococcoidia bacterium]|nr:hypothetical protein [Dehalococcoidia bacterium]